MSALKTISIVDDHPLLLDGMKHIITNMDDLQLVHVCTDSLMFLKAFMEEPTDLVIIDVHMKGKDGLECTQIIKSKYPQTKVIIYSMFLEKSIIVKAIRFGADAYLDKSVSEAELKQKISSVISDKKSDTIESNKNENNELSIREKEIAITLLEGFKAEEIAAKFSISSLTVRTHIRNIYTKLHISGAHELAKVLSENPEILGI